MSLNTVCLDGRLTRDPYMSNTQDVSIAHFTLAVQRNYKNKSTGEYDADFIRCVAFSRTADFLHKYCQQGDAISVTGQLQTQNYQDKEGNKRVATEVHVNQADFTPTNKPKANTSPQEPITEANRAKPNDYAQTKQKPADDPFKSTGNTIDINDDQLPF